MPRLLSALGDFFRVGFVTAGAVMGPALLGGIAYASVMAPPIPSLEPADRILTLVLITTMVLCAGAGFVFPGRYFTGWILLVPAVLHAWWAFHMFFLDDPLRVRMCGCIGLLYSWRFVSLWVHGTTKSGRSL